MGSGVKEKNSSKRGKLLRGGGGHGNCHAYSPQRNKNPMIKSKYFGITSLFVATSSKDDVGRKLLLTHSHPPLSLPPPPLFYYLHLDFFSIFFLQSTVCTLRLAICPVIFGFTQLSWSPKCCLSRASPFFRDGNDRA